MSLARLYGRLLPEILQFKCNLRHYKSPLKRQHTLETYSDSVIRNYSTNN